MKKLALLFIGVLLINSCAETLPTVDYTYSIDKYNPLKVDFTANIPNTEDYGTLTTEWNFGDGAVGVESQATHVFKEPGEYDVTLILKSSKTYIDGVKATKKIPVKIEIFDLDFQYVSNPVSPLELTFTASGELANGVIDYEWDFGFKKMTGTSVTVTFPKPQPYNVTLKAKIQDTTFSQTLKKDIDLSLDIKGLDFTFNPDPFDPLNVQFSAIGNATMGEVQYEWDFGFGNKKTGKSVINRFTNIGFFDVNLVARILDSEVTKTITKNINTSMYISNADFTYGKSSSNPLELIFSGIGDSPTGDVEFEWDFGNGVRLRTQNTNYRFMEFGEHIVTLKITIPGTNVAQIVTKTVKIDPPEIQNLDFTITQSKTDPLSFFLETNAKPSFGSATYEWDFGFGQRASGKSTVVKFDDYGDNLVKLTVALSNTSAEEFVYKIINIPAPKIEGLHIDYFRHPKDPLQINLIADAKITSQKKTEAELGYQWNANIEYEVDYEWDFGFGRKATGKDINYRFDFLSEYKATVIAKIRDTRIKDDTSREINVRNDDKIDFNCYSTKNDIMNIEYTCKPTILPNSGMSKPTFKWNFGDDPNKIDNTADGEIVTHIYPKLAKYTVTLTVDDPILQTPEEFKKDIYVLIKPEVGRYFTYRVSKPETISRERDVYVSLLTQAGWINDPHAYYNGLYDNIDTSAIDVIVNAEGDTCGNNAICGIPVLDSRYHIKDIPKNGWVNPQANFLGGGLSEFLLYHRRGHKANLRIWITYRFKNPVNSSYISSSTGEGYRDWSGY